MPYPPVPVPELILSTPDGKILSQRKLDATRGYWVGRDSTCDVVIDEATVSRRHAFVFSSNGRWLACDAGSMQGFETESGTVRSAALCADAWVRIGSVYLWLGGAPGKPPEWIDARGEPGGEGRPPRIVKFAIEAMEADEPAPVQQVLVVADRDGGVHLCADLSGLATSKGGGAPRLTIGRANAMDLQLCHPSVDPLHAVIAIGSEKCSLIDAGSTAGILYGGKRWYRKRLEAGITLPVGDFRVSIQRIARSTASLPPAPNAAPGAAPRLAPRKPSAFLDDPPDELA